MRGAVLALGAGVSAYTVGAQIAARWFEVAVRRGRSDRPWVALTFDDGPAPDSTPPVLDVLRQHQAPATFFVVGSRVRAHPEVVRRAVAEGHELGNHTFGHRHLWTLGPGATRREIEAGAAAIADITSRPPGYFRAPWGIYNLAAFSAAREAHERLVGWTVASEGCFWEPDPAAMARHLLAHAAPGAILNLHDAGGHPDTPRRVLAALPLLLDGLAVRGLVCVSLHDLLL